MRRLRAVRPRLLGDEVRPDPPVVEVPPREDRPCPGRRGPRSRAPSRVRRSRPGPGRPQGPCRGRHRAKPLGRSGRCRARGPPPRRLRTARRPPSPPRWQHPRDRASPSDRRGRWRSPGPAVCRTHGTRPAVDPMPVRCEVISSTYARSRCARRSGGAPTARAVVPTVGVARIAITASVTSTRDERCTGPLPRFGVVRLPLASDPKSASLVNGHPDRARPPQHPFRGIGDRRPSARRPPSRGGTGAAEQHVRAVTSPRASRGSRCWLLPAGRGSPWRAR